MIRFSSKSTQSIHSLLSDHLSHLFNSLHRSYNDKRSISAISNRCEDWLFANQPGKELNIENDGQFYLCLKRAFK